MKKCIGILLLLVSFKSFGQTNAKFADSILSHFHIPELSYAVVTEDSILEMVALGHHAIHYATRLINSQSRNSAFSRR